MELFNDWYRIKENATLVNARFKSEDICRDLISDINIGDVVVRDRSADDIGIRNRAREFTVEKFYPHHALLHSRFGYRTSVGYLELRQRYHKKGAKSKYALEEL